MKKVVIIFLICFFITTTVFANPVESTECTTGGEFGNHIVITLSHDYDYGTLTINRQNSSKNYSRNINNFAGGSYRMDLSSQGGITGFSVSYKNEGDLEYQTYAAPLNCGDAVAEQNELPEEVMAVDNAQIENAVETAQTAPAEEVVQPEQTTQPEETAVSVQTEETPAPAQTVEAETVNNVDVIKQTTPVERTNNDVPLIKTTENVVPVTVPTAN